MWTVAALRTLLRLRRRPRVFVSYRRSDGGHAAARLAEKFKRHFDLFWDIEGIGPGKDFPREIRKAIEDSHQVLVLIGPRWATERDAFNRRRIDDPMDWVVHEIAAGLRRQVVMPVLIDDARMPERSDLPPHIATLSDLHAVPVRLASFDDDAGRLRRAIWEAVAPPPWPVWRKALVSFLLVAAAVAGIVFATYDGAPDPSGLRVGEPVTFTYQEVTVSDLRFDATYGHVVQAKVCVRKLPPGETESRLTWKAWRVEDTTGRTYTPTSPLASRPSAFYPHDGRYDVGECVSGLIPFSTVRADTKLTKVHYLGREHQATWTR